MNELDVLGRLAKVSQREQAPAVDVSRKVVLMLSGSRFQPDRSLAWIAGLALAATLPVAVWAVMSVDALTDPLQELFLPLNGVLL